MADKLAKLSTAETSLSPPQGVHYKHATTRLNFSDMFSALYQHCFQEWNIQHQTDTRGNAQSYLSCPGTVFSTDPFPFLLFSVCALVTAN